MYHVKLVALDFFARALAGRSWSLGGWELHDYRRTGVFIDLSCCFDIIFTPLQQNSVSTLYQSCIFLSLFPSARQNVRTSLTSTSRYFFHYIISISFQLFLFHPNSDGRTLTCVYSFQNHHLPQILMQKQPPFPLVLRFLLSHTLPYNFYFYFSLPYSPSTLFFFSLVAFHLLTGIGFLFSLLLCFWTGFCLFRLSFSTCLLISFRFFLFSFFFLPKSLF